MNVVETLFEREQYSLAAEEKVPLLLSALGELRARHAAGCSAFAAVLERLFPDVRRAEPRRLADVEYLAVRLFKQLDLVSVPQDRIVKRLTSSGTTGAEVSRIALDDETSALQRRALASIMTSFLGPKRLPMILVDTKSVLRDRASFSARGAGLLGMANFGRNHFYALNDDMSLDEAGLDAFLERHAEEPVLVFGFTFMVWQYLVERLRACGKRLPLAGSILVHGGGWKKLQERSISAAAFKHALAEHCHIERVHDFYGMVEQVGSVYVECEAGFFHAPNFSDVLIRDHRDWSVLPPGAVGVVQSLSVLPRSYPGHSILTEDLGVVHGIDDCACGRLATRFELRGRVPRSQLRGCSDTHAQGAAP